MELKKFSHEFIIDYESRSRKDIDVGNYLYSTDPSTSLLCIGSKLDDSRSKVWSPEDGSLPPEFIEAVVDPRVQLIAHNAGFDRSITKYVLPRYVKKSSLRDKIKAIPISRWKCTAAKAASHALPRSLAGACAALGLVNQKDKEGSKVLKKYYRPRKPTKNNPKEWHDDPLELMRIYEYCLADIDAQYELDHSIPDLSPYEQEIWELDQVINDRGLRLDIPFVKKVLALADIERERLTKKVYALTKGAIESPTKNAQVIKYVNDRGAKLPNIQKETIANYLLQDNINPHVREVLEIRQKAARTSLGKYVAMLERSDEKYVARDHLMYWGASTGRWTGKGIQLQNLPKGIEGLDPEEAIDILNTGGEDLLRLVYGDNITGVLSSCIRSMITAPEGEEFFDADFSGIEARVLFWLADHTKGIDSFLRRIDQYKIMAGAIYGVSPDEIEKGLRRNVGKKAFLGCGYGMGWVRFKESCEEEQIFIDAKTSKKAVNSYRKVHKPVTQLWSNIERAAIKAVRTGKKVSINHVTFFVKNNFLYCRLPSGRCLAYYKPRAVKTVKFNRPCWELRHWAEVGDAKIWMERSTWGGVLVENIVQAIARDLMVASMRRIEAAGFPICLTVHDEILARRKKGRSTLDEFNTLMKQLEPWAKGIPVEVDGWKGLRFKK